MPQGHNLIDPAIGANAIKSSVKFSTEPTRIIDTSYWDPRTNQQKNMMDVYYGSGNSWTKDTFNSDTGKRFLLRNIPFLAF